MSEMKDTFKNYMDMILSSGYEEPSKSIDDLSDFDDIDADNDLDICRSIFAAKEDSLESYETEKTPGEKIIITISTTI